LRWEGVTLILWPGFLLLLEEVVDLVEGFVYCAAVLGVPCPGGLGEFLAFGVGAEEGEGVFDEVDFVADDEGAAAIHELAGDLAEIGHVGAEDDRFAEGGGFDGGLASVVGVFGGEAFADEN